jgi:glycosyltransferase involved in cell wall biosynthesis
MKTGDKTARRVVQVGPSPDAMGGIAAVLGSYRSSRLAELYDLTFVTTTAGERGIRRWSSFARALLELSRECARRPRPIVHVHMASRGSFYRKLTVLIVARAQGCPILLHLHGAEFHRFAAGGTSMRRWLVRLAFRIPQCVIVLSPEWEQRVAVFARPRCVVAIPNPVSIPVRRARGSSPPHVLFLGQLGSRKGVDVLLQAIRGLQGAGIRATYTLAGDGSQDDYRESARLLPQPEAVVLPGWLSGSSKTEELERSDIFCLPSREEGVPIALLEAMSWGLACVATPVGGIPSTIEDGKTGVLVSPGASDSLANALSALLSDSALRRRLGDAARDRAIEGYALDVVVDRLARVYDDL